MFSFSIDSTDGHARAGVLKTPHGSIQTPVFMPVGTAATAVRCTAGRTIQATIATGALTAGKVYYHIEYMLSTPAI